MLPRFLIALLAALLPLGAAPVVEPGSKKLPLPGESLLFDGHEAFVIAPQDSAGPQPWVLYAPTLKGLPSMRERWMFERLLESGIAIAGIDVGESYGNQTGQDIYSAFHNYLVGERNFSPKPVLLARSRGGLMLYNWATAHPDKVAAVAGIYPVCNLASYPGLAKAAPAYGMTAAELEAEFDQHNPLGRLAPLARAKVPLFHIHGDQDKVVPLEKNSAALAEAYRALGGPATVEVIKDGGHDLNLHWFRSESLTRFMIEHAEPKEDGTGDAEAAQAEAEGDPLKKAVQNLKFPGVHIDPEARTVDVECEVALRNGALELIACLPDTKEHEAIVMTTARPMHIHTALLLVGAKAGHPAMQRRIGEDPPRWINVPPTGGPVKVSLAFKDTDGKEVVRPIADFIMRITDHGPPVFENEEEDGDDAEDLRFPTSTFLFTGSHLLDGKEGQPKRYLADETGNVVSISTFGDELLGLPMVIGHDNQGLVWEVDSTHLPALGSKVRLRLEPVFEEGR